MCKITTVAELHISMELKRSVSLLLTFTHCLMHNTVTSFGLNVKLVPHWPHSNGIMRSSEPKETVSMAVRTHLCIELTFCFQNPDFQHLSCENSDEFQVLQLDNL